MELPAKRAIAHHRSFRGDIEAILYEAGSLLALVRFVKEYITEHEQAYRYSGSTKAFFRTIKEMARETEDAIAKSLNNSCARPEAIRERYRPGIALFQKRWVTIQSFVKPAADAHSLAAPVPLLRLALKQLRLIIHHAEIVVLLTPELMYFQKGLREFPANIPQLLPDHFGFIEIPYSQGTSLFLNLNVFHEIGHFLFESLFRHGSQGFDSLADALKRAVDAEPILAALPRNTKPQIRDPLEAIRDPLEAWTREIFCDLFAIRLVGPAFTFALIDLLWSSDLMRHGNESDFDVDHPSPALRMRVQLKQLKKDRWWETVRNTRCDQLDTIRRLARIRKRTGELGLKPATQAALFRAFDSVVPQIERVVDQLTEHVNAREAANDFQRFQVRLEKCLASGIVPSAVMTQGRKLSPAVLLNAAYVFQMTKLPLLMGKVNPSKDNIVVTHAKWRQKVEAWTMKALEDLELATNAAAGGV